MLWKLASAFCLLALVSAPAASVVFSVSGLMADGSALTGNMTIDTTGGAITAVNLNVGAPGNTTFNSLTGSFQFAAGSPGYVVGLFSASTSMQLVLVSNASGSLVGYAGGAINTTSNGFSFFGSPADPLISGALSSALPPTITKSFGSATVPLNGSTSLTFNINNPNTVALSAINFTDTFPSGLVVATPSGMSNTCGGLVTAIAGSGSVTLATGSLAASSSCTVSLNVTATSAGVKNNSVTVSDASAGTGNTSTATVTVVMPPAITKTFTDSLLTFVPVTTLTFNVGNPNPVVTLTGVSFTDTLPGGLVVSSPNGLSGNCGAGTITAIPGTNSITLSNAFIPPLATCVFSVAVTGTTDGSLTNTTSPVSSTNGGSGSPASAAITVRRYMLYLWFFS